MFICKYDHFLFFHLSSSTHLVCASSFSFLHGRTGLPPQIPAQLQSLLCLLSPLSSSDFLQVNLQWKLQREKQLNLLQDNSKGSQFLQKLSQIYPFSPLQFQVFIQKSFPPRYRAVFDHFCTGHMVELTFVSILMYYNPGFKQDFAQILIRPSDHGVFDRFYTCHVVALTLGSTFIYNNPIFAIIILHSNALLTILPLEIPSPSTEEVDIESMEVQIAVNQASKGFGSSTNSTSSQSINNFFAPVGGANNPSPMNFDDLFEESSFNLEHVVVLTHVPKEVDWDAIKILFSSSYGQLNLEYSALDRNSDVCYLAFKEISAAEASKSYKGPIGRIDLTHNRNFIQAEFMIDSDPNLPYRVMLFNVQAGDTREALSSKMEAVPIKIKIFDGKNFAVAMFDVISEWCKVLAQQYFVVNNHAISIVDALDQVNRANFYRLWMGWVPRVAKHAHLCQVVQRISGHLPLHLDIIRDKNNNHSRGFTFLVVKTLAEKEKLLNANLFTLKTCKCKFKEARPLKRVAQP